MTGHGRLTIFSIVFGIVYTLAFFFGLAAFKYYPLVGQFHIVDQAKAAGPPISCGGLPIAFRRSWPD